MRRLPRPSRPSAPFGRCSKARLPWTGRPPRRPSSSERSRRRARGRGSASATRKHPCCETFTFGTPAPAEGYPFPPIGRLVFGKSRKIAENRPVGELERSMWQSPLSVNIMGWAIRGDMDCLCRRPVRLRRNPDTNKPCRDRVYPVRKENPDSLKAVPTSLLSKNRGACRHALPVLPLLPEWGPIFLILYGSSASGGDPTPFRSLRVVEVVRPKVRLRRNPETLDPLKRNIALSLFADYAIVGSSIALTIPEAGTSGCWINPQPSAGCLKKYWRARYEQGIYSGHQEGR